MVSMQRTIFGARAREQHQHELDRCCICMHLNRDDHEEGNDERCMIRDEQDGMNDGRWEMRDEGGR